MKEIRFFYVPEAAQQEELPQDEALHALRVLRLKGGDELFLISMGYNTPFSSMTRSISEKANQQI